MDSPRIRPGMVAAGESTRRIAAYFSNSAQGNAAIQLLTALGVPNDALGVLPPEGIASGQGMVLSIPCPTDALLAHVESVCRGMGAAIHRQRP